MALFKVFRGKAENLPEPTHDGYAYLTTDTGKFYIDSGDRRILINPDLTAENITYNNDTTVAAVLDNLISKNTSQFEIHTNQYWNQHGDQVSQEGVFYVFSNAISLYDGTIIPRIKMGNGINRIIDLPFLDQLYYNHILNTDIHVTPAQKEFWNTKLICSEQNIGVEQVIFQYDTFNF